MSQRLPLRPEQSSSAAKAMGAGNGIPLASSWATQGVDPMDKGPRCGTSLPMDPQTDLMPLMDGWNFRLLV